MKLATYQDGSRDGQLVVVSRDLRRAHHATGIAPNLQAVLDDWSFMAPQLQDLFDQLNAGQARYAFDFEPQRCMAPLPRPFAWLGAQAYPSHAQLLHQAWPERYPRPVDGELSLALRWAGHLTGPNVPIGLTTESLAADFEAELLVYAGDVRAGISSEAAIDAVRLLGLCSGIWLRQRPRQKPMDGLQANVQNTMAPVVVTPDELGAAWADGRLHLPVQCMHNARKVGVCDAAAGMAFDFGTLLAQAAAGRRLGAGTLVSAGAISTPAESGPDGLWWPQGGSSLLARQAMEQLRDGDVQTGWLKAGDSVRVEVKGRDGWSVFGAIEQGMTLAHH